VARTRGGAIVNGSSVTSGLTAAVASSSATAVRFLLDPVARHMAATLVMDGGFTSQ
jgi:hypothetical protein